MVYQIIFWLFSSSLFKFIESVLSYAPFTENIEINANVAGQSGATLSIMEL